jgi:hypothetical protein
MAMDPDSEPFCLYCDDRGCSECSEDRPDEDEDEEPEPPFRYPTTPEYPTDQLDKA